MNILSFYLIRFLIKICISVAGFIHQPFRNLHQNMSNFLSLATAVTRSQLNWLWRFRLSEGTLVLGSDTLAFVLASDW
jgi:hypothetical protein